MTTPARELEQGSIVELNVTDPRGNRKPHPVVVITPTREIVLDAEIVGIVISSSVPDPLPPTCLAVPWFRGRHPVTGLDRRCAAVCDWAAIFRQSDILYVRGFMPLKYVHAIVQRFAELSK